MAGANAVLGLAVFGLISGLFSGALIVCFRYAAETLQHEFMPLGDIENFEGLARYLHFWLPVAGAALLGVAFQLLRQPERQVGIGHVIERLAYHEGYLPLKNFLAQFLGGIVSLVSGHSVGRESPSVHIGAAGSSFIGRRFGLPNNGVRTLVACGSAAAIAASFNTPLAGVVFAMEVILVEYTIAGFTPVILAAVAGSALSRLAFGDQPVLQLPQVGVTSLSELVLIVAMGLVCG
ncbi:MAG: chloride channel protein, partial [Gammaproteobacteria bacterium]|nr:chloride channel protein [Gammaproteobacteria bacterium]